VLLPDLGEFHFLRPYWLLGLLLALMVATIAARARPRSRWQAVIDPALLPVMLEAGSSATARHLPWLIAFTLGLSSLALAGPTWQRLPQPVEQRSDALVLVLDLSLSMYAGDVAPSRLVRARHKLVDVLRQRDEGYTALVVYAGDAHTVAPLTDDVATIENLLGTLEPAMMPVLGSNLDEAVRLANELFDSAGVATGRILLVTDGVNSPAGMAEQCNPSRPLSVLGVGTADGGPIPLDFADQPGRYLTDRSGRRVIARLDEQRLMETAQLCHGEYRRLAIGDTDIQALLRDTAAVRDSTEAGERRFDLWVDAGQYLTLALLPLALFGFRRGVVVGMLMTVALPVDASLWDDLWLRHDQQGWAALRGGEPERALRLFEDSRWQGIARYRSGSFEDAEIDFASDPSATGHYNRGNALAHQGRYADALAAYDEALALAPDDEDAAYNKALVEQLMKAQQSAEEQAGSEASDRSPSQDPQSRTEGSSDDETAQSSADPKETERDENEPGAPEDNRQDAQSRPDAEDTATETELPRDAQQDALDQWLRRIPDDPGGLLRRKFQYETNQRMRRGQYPDRDEERIW